MITRKLICAMVYFVTVSGAVANADTDDAENVKAHPRDQQAKALPAGGDVSEQPAYRLGNVTGAIQFNPLLRPAKIMVEMSGERSELITLSGYVGSTAEKDLAEQLALSVKGVAQVHNRLIVAPKKLKQFMDAAETSIERPEQRLSNVTISNKVKSQLLANRRTSGINIDVTTQNRIVTISGETDSAAEKELAYWVVKNTQGVKEVVDKLDVANPEVRHASIQVPEQTVVEQQ